MDDKFDMPKKLPDAPSVTTLHPQDSSYDYLVSPLSVHTEPVPDDMNDNSRVLARQTPSGVSRGVQQLGSMNVNIDSGNKRIVVNDGSNRVLMGNQTTFGEGFYVGKPGKDVTKITNSSDFIFSSAQDVLRIAQRGTNTIPGLASPPGNTTASPSLNFTFKHGLGYAPTFAIYLVNIKIDWWGQQLLGQTVQGPVGYFDVSGDNNNFYDVIALADAFNFTVYNNWTTKAAPHAIPAITVAYQLYASPSTS